MTLTDFFKTGAAACIASAALFATVSPTQAQEATFTFSVERVSLENNSAVLSVYSRLEAEAERYCGALETSDSASEARICERDVVDAVVQQIGDRQLSAHHARLTGQAAGLPFITALTNPD